MKNLYLLPTDKPIFNRLMPIILDGENQNLYIISDEEIKDGEYAISLNLVRKGYNSDYAVFKMNLEQRQAGEELNIKKDEVLKVILTTDQDLIKNGVQEIDNDFLKWFVNNSSCEEVKIFRLWVSLFNFEYEIIFPKEPTILDSQYVDFSNPNADKITSGTTNKPLENKHTAMQELFDNLEAIDIKVPIGVKKIFLEKEKKQMRKTYSQGWTTRERFDDLSPDIIYPKGLDYEEKQDYAFNLWFEQFKK